MNYLILSLKTQLSKNSLQTRELHTKGVKAEAAWDVFEIVGGVTACTCKKDETDLKAL